MTFRPCLRPARYSFNTLVFRSTQRPGFSLCALALLALLSPSRGYSFPDTVMPGTVLRTLPNGLRLIVREVHGAPLVAIDLWVRAGSGYDAAGESGTAHFLEHLIFKGTPTRGSGEIDAAFGDLGSTLNAGTTRDGAHFSSTLASAYLSSALEVLADAVMHPLLPQNELVRERSVILDEVARSRNDWRKLAVDRLWARLYPDSTYARPILGNPDSLRSISRDNVKSFYDRTYSADNATLVLVGDVTPGAAEELTKRYFETWTKRTAPPTSNPGNSPESDLSVSNPVEETGTDKGAIVSIGFRSPRAADDAEVCAADVLTALLADPRAGRLTSSIRAYSAAGEWGADFTTVRGPGVFSVFVRTDMTRAPTALRMLESEVQKLQTEAISADELEFAKRRVIGAYLFDIETYGGQARMLGLHDVLGSYESAQNYTASIRKVSIKNLQDFAVKYLGASKRVELIIRPPEAKGAK